MTMMNYYGGQGPVPMNTEVLSGGMQTMPNPSRPAPIGDALAAPPGAVGGGGAPGAAGTGAMGLTWGDALAALNLIKRPPTPPPGSANVGNPTSRPAPIAQQLPLQAPGGLGQFI